jgi:hypothetical protein
MRLGRAQPARKATHGVLFMMQTVQHNGVRKVGNSYTETRRKLEPRGLRFLECHVDINHTKSYNFNELYLT